MKNQFRFNFILSFRIGWFSVSINNVPPQFHYMSRSFHFGPLHCIRFYPATIPILYKRPL